MKDFQSRLRSLTAEPSSDDGQDKPRMARVQTTRTEMMRQGEAVLETLAHAREDLSRTAALAAERKITRIVIAGCGDSWFAAIGARMAMEQAAGLPVEPVQAFDWAHFASRTIDPQVLVLGLSSGGATPAVVAALDAARGRGALTCGMSNTIGSHVMTAYDYSLLVKAKRQGWPTQSSMAAMALMMALGVAIGKTRGTDAALLEELSVGLSATALQMDEVAKTFDLQARAWAEEVAETSLMLFAGAGPHYAAAAFGAAKVKELCPIHAYAMPLEEYHHYRSQKTGDPIFLVAPDAASRERALDTALVSNHVGGRTVALLPGSDAEIESRVSETWHMPACNAALAPLLYSVPVHLFAYHLAMVRFERGLGYVPALELRRAVA